MNNRDNHRKKEVFKWVGSFNGYDFVDGYVMNRKEMVQIWKAYGDLADPSFDFMIRHYMKLNPVRTYEQVIYQVDKWVLSDDGHDCHNHIRQDLGQMSILEDPLYVDSWLSEYDKIIAMDPHEEETMIGNMIFYELDDKIKRYVLGRPVISEEMMNTVLSSTNMIPSLDYISKLPKQELLPLPADIADTSIHRLFLNAKN